MGDDIGFWNISKYNMGMMGYHTPNIDRIRYPASQVLIDHAMTLQKEPPIKEGTPDPYIPNE